LNFADIQEFYEATLLDQQLSTHQKTQATLRVAEKYASMDDMQPVGNGLAAADDVSIKTCVGSYTFPSAPTKG